MSKSFKKSPVTSWCSTSGQKQYRSQENRAKRKKVNQVLTMVIKDITECNKDVLLPDDKEYGNEWSSPRDGKCWNKNLDDEYKRK